MKPSALAIILGCCLAACSKSPPPAAAPPSPAAAPPPTAAAPATPAAATPTLPPDIISGSSSLPSPLKRRTGDLDVMMRARNIRALVIVSRTSFFYDKGHPRGISYEALEEFQRFLNAKFKTGALKTTITFVPVRPEQLEPALLQGAGDVVATEVFVTPERAREVLFTVPLATGVQEVIVTGPAAPPLASVDDLSGVEVYANPLTVAYTSLQRLSARLRQQGRPEIKLRAADKNLSTEDLLEMVDAGLDSCNRRGQPQGGVLEQGAAPGNCAPRNRRA